MHHPYNQIESNQMRTNGLSITIAILLLAATGCTQQVAQKSSRQTSNVHDYQACMKCRYATMASAGKCSNCGSQKVQIRGRDVSVCPKDQEVLPKSQTTCAKHKANLGARILTYYCSADKTSSSQSGNCSKCGKFRTKHILMTSAPR